LDELAKRYGQRPSQVLGIADEWAAYQLDVATLTVGRWVDGKLSERNKQGRPIHRLTDLLRDKPAQGQSSSGYRSAAGFVVRKMQIPASGVW
jgi:hypothetical protein